MGNPLLLDACAAPGGAPVYYWCRRPSIREWAVLFIPLAVGFARPDYRLDATDVRDFVGHGSRAAIGWGREVVGTAFPKSGPPLVERRRQSEHGSDIPKRSNRPEPIIGRWSRPSEEGPPDHSRRLAME
eukprot:g22277.t1